MGEVTFAKDSQLTTIAERAFADCYILETITIPKKVKEIQEGAFFWCIRLKSVTFEPGSELTTVHRNAFSGCDNLQTVYYDGNNNDVIAVLSSLKTNERRRGLENLAGDV